MRAPDEYQEVLSRELEYHQRLYSGFAQSHFARPAVRALRAHMVSRILRATGAGSRARVLSLGCGIGDTELLLARHVGEITGIDLSPAAIQQARADAGAAGIHNARFIEGALESADLHRGSFDVVMAIFFLHHLPDAALARIAAQVRELLAPGGKFYSLDPSRYRLSGLIGSLLIPKLMRRYQTADERELAPAETARLFGDAAFEARFEYYDFISSPLAGVFPGWRAGYRVARVLDELLVRVPLLRKLGSNFEVNASAP